MSIRRAEAELTAAVEEAQAAEDRLQRARLAVIKAHERRATEPGIGTAIRYNVRFPGGTDPYTYLALRTRKGWYITGQKGPKTWDNILDIAERNASGVPHFEIL